MIIEILASEAEKGDKFSVFGHEVTVVEVEPSVTGMTTFLHYPSLSGNMTTHIAVSSEAVITVERKAPDEDLVEAMCVADFYACRPYAVGTWDEFRETEREFFRAGMRAALAVARERGAL